MNGLGIVSELRERQKSYQSEHSSRVTQLDRPTAQIKETHRKNELKKSINF